MDALVVSVPELVEGPETRVSVAKLIESPHCKAVLSFNNEKCRNRLS
jgi:hypothetical protein